MPNYDQDYVQVITDTTTGSFTATEVWVIISCILAVIGGIALYVMYLNPKNEKNFKGELLKIHRFFNFKITIIQPILKVLYLISAIAVTLGAFAYIGSNFFKFLFILVVGNIGLRMTFEVLLLLMTLINNVREINKKIPENVIEEKTKKKVPKKEKGEE